MTRTSRLAVGTIVVGLLVLGLKYLAYAWTGSVALYSDALESVINVATAIATFAAVTISARPADDNHPYGHDKAEYLSAVLESALILVAALLILREAYQGLLSPRPLNAPAIGLAINVVASVINAAWSMVLMRLGKRWRSPALQADAHHLLTDVASSMAVVVGVGLAALTGWGRLDAIIAAIVAIHILWAGWKLMRASVGGLMDEAVAADTRTKIEAVITREGSGALQAHTLRTRQSAARTFIEFSLVTPGSMTVAQAHTICDRIEAALDQAIEGCSIVIHIEPHDQAVRDDAFPILPSTTQADCPQ